MFVDCTAYSNSEKLLLPSATFAIPFAEFATAPPRNVVFSSVRPDATFVVASPCVRFADAAMVQCSVVADAGTVTQLDSVTALHVVARGTYCNTYDGASVVAVPSFETSKRSRFVVFFTNVNAVSSAAANVAATSLPSSLRQR